MSTDAREEARRYYREHGRRLADDLEAMAVNPRSVLLYMPRLVVLMKPAKKDSPEGWDRLAESPQDADAWYIHLLVGDLEMARRMATDVERLPWACFHRGRRDTRGHVLPWAVVTRQFPAAQVPRRPYSC